MKKKRYHCPCRSKGAVTIATNMAGRGTDIKLGEGVRNSAVCRYGTERHEARRIDNQLRGRAVVRATPVTAVLSVYRRRSDEKICGDRFKSLLNMIAKPDQEGNETLDLKMFSRFVSAQRKVEGSNRPPEERRRIRRSFA